MAGLVPAIHVLVVSSLPDLIRQSMRRRCPATGYRFAYPCDACLLDITRSHIITAKYTISFHIHFFQADRGARQSLWASILTWIRDNQIGDLAGIAGIFISIVGFIATLIGVAKSKNAARSAEDAANKTRESVRSLDAILDFSATISALEEIKRLQRQNAWSLLPERYAAARKLLILFRESGVILSNAEKSFIQDAIVDFKDLEAKIDRLQDTPERLNSARLNSIISGQIDNLVVVLSKLKTRKERSV
jgi:hypothetical protein